MRLWTTLALCLILTACGSSRNYTPLPKTGSYKVGKPYEIAGRWYYPEYDPSYDERGIASWYGSAFHGKPTANGEVFDKNRVSAAHTTLPLPSIVEVTNLENGRSLVIRVNDRGPFVGDRIIDLSEAAARELGFRNNGLAKVRVRFLKLADDAAGARPEPKLAEARTEIAPAAGPKRDEPPVARAPVCRRNEHFVQVAALSEPGRAQELADQVAVLGPVWQEAVPRGADLVYRVRIGPLPNRRQAFDVLSGLRHLGYQQAYVADCGDLPPSSA